MKSPVEEVFIGLGSNLGDREKNLRRAVAQLQSDPNIYPTEVSNFLETAPWGVLDQPAFLNAIAVVRTALSPEQLLRTLKAAERALGRAADGPRWGPRVIDLDILLYGNRIVRTPELVVPHPRLSERDFVLIQLSALRPDLRHPETGQLLRTVLETLQGDSSKI